MAKKITRSRLRHFLDIDQIEADVLRAILKMAADFKKGRDPSKGRLVGKSLAMIFEKPSTRTRVSFEVGMQQLGGGSVILTHHDTQLGRGETIADTARVLSRYVDAIMIRTDAPEKLAELSRHATVPVINGLTDLTHPCQIMADVMTFEELRGPIKGRTIAWSGDGNNVATSWIHAAARLDFTLRLACPRELAPNAAAIRWARAQGASIALTQDPAAAAKDADCIVTDTWVSMGAAKAAARKKLLTPYQVNEALMKKAKKNALFMHCLPAHRGEEVTDSVMDGPNSAVWDEAENRLHVQKGILAWCMGI